MSLLARKKDTMYNVGWHTLQGEAGELAEAEAGLVSQQLPLLRSAALQQASDSRQGPLGKCVRVHVFLWVWLCMSM